MFKLLKGFTTIREAFNDLKLYTVEVCIYQTSKLFIQGENTRQN